MWKGIATSLVVGRFHAEIRLTLLIAGLSCFKTDKKNHIS